MEINFEKPMTFTLCGLKDNSAFVPYRQNFNFPLKKGDSITFNDVSSEKGIYYSKQNGDSIEAYRIPENLNIDAIAGIYNTSTETFTASSTYGIVNKSTSANNTNGVDAIFDVIGTLVYADADANIGQPAGYRFICNLKNPDITSKSDLPGGDICRVVVIGGELNTDHTYNKNAFESDGSLVLISNIKDINTVVTVSITWASGKTSTYTFTFKNVDFAKDVTVNNVTHFDIKLPITVTLTNVNPTYAITYMLYELNVEEKIAVGNSVNITVENSEEAMYYLLQANKDLIVTFTNSEN